MAGLIMPMLPIMDWAWNQNQPFDPHHWGDTKQHFVPSSDGLAHFCNKVMSFWPILDMF